MNNNKSTDGQKPVDVIILNWNGRKLLEKFLPSVVENCDTRVARIVVADNGSDDGSLALLQQNFPNVEVMRFDKNYGFAEGYNKAISLSTAPYVVLLNSDVATTPAWDTELFDFMEEHPDVGACMPKILSYNKPGMFEYAGAAGGFIDCNGFPFCRGRIFDRCEPDEGQYDTPMDVFWASGAALMIRRQLYLDAGGLDARFFAHMEEIDLCWRILLAGYRICAVPSSAVYHLGGGSLPAENPRKTYLNFRNNLLMLYKNLPDDCRGRILVRRRLLDTVAWAKFVLTFDWRNAAAVIRAHRDFSRMRKLYDADNKPRPDRNLLETGMAHRCNIITDFYMRRLFTFSRVAERHGYV